MFTHNHIYWIAGLLLAFVQLPDFSTPLNSISDSLERLVGGRRVAPAEPERNTEDELEGPAPPLTPKPDGPPGIRLLEKDVSHA